MVQYNPYAVKLRGRLWKLDYLVGVATEESAAARDISGTYL